MRFPWGWKAPVPGLCLAGWAKCFSLLAFGSWCLVPKRCTGQGCCVHLCLSLVLVWHLQYSNVPFRVFFKYHILVLFAGFLHLMQIPLLQTVWLCLLPGLTAPWEAPCPSLMWNCWGVTYMAWRSSRYPICGRSVPLWNAASGRSSSVVQSKWLLASLESRGWVSARNRTELRCVPELCRALKPWQHLTWSNAADAKLGPRGAPSSGVLPKGNEQLLHHGLDGAEPWSSS